MEISTIIKSALLLSAIMLLNGNYKIEKSNYFYFYVGTYTNNGGKGIYLYKMERNSGELEKISITEGVLNPSFLTIDRSKNCLYAVNEISDFDGTNSGSISAFKIDSLTKQLSFINKKSSNGADPCYITVDNKNGFVLTANYSGGNISLHPTDASGALVNSSDIVQHKGSSKNEARQNKPHTHSIILDAENKYAYAADLGIDKILVYSINPETKKFILQSNTDVVPGSGPRHLAIHPNGQYAYVINELNSRINFFKIHNMDGSLTEIGSCSALPEGFNGTSYCADIHIHPNGKYLYGSNRGDNSIAIFEIDEITGLLKNIAFEPTQGEWPRNFTIDPSGNFLLAANQKSNNITVFKIDKNTGLLHFSGISEKIPSPVCLVFYNTSGNE